MPDYLDRLLEHARQEAAPLQDRCRGRLAARGFGGWLGSTPAVAASAVVASSLAVAVVSLAGAGQPPPLALAWLAVPACAWAVNSSDSNSSERGSMIGLRKGMP